MKNYILLWVGCLYWVPASFAQLSPGARLAATGNQKAAVNDIWAVEANPAGFGSMTRPAFQLSYHQYFLAKELRRQAFAFAAPFGKSITGFYLRHEGIPEYQDLQVSWVLARTFGTRFSIGIRSNLHRLHIPEYGTSSRLSIDAGSFYQLNDKISLGLYIDNLSKSLPTNRSALPVSHTCYAGIAYMLHYKVLMAGTLTFREKTNPQYAIGIDYMLSEQFSIRSGLNIAPISHHMGLGIKKATFNLDAAFIMQTSSGYSSLISLGYAF